MPICPTCGAYHIRTPCPTCSPKNSENEISERSNIRPANQFKAIKEEDKTTQIQEPETFSEPSTQQEAETTGLGLELSKKLLATLQQELNDKDRKIEELEAQLEQKDRIIADLNNQLKKK